MYSGLSVNGGNFDRLAAVAGDQPGRDGGGVVGGGDSAVASFRAAEQRKRNFGFGSWIVPISGFGEIKRKRKKKRKQNKTGEQNIKIEQIKSFTNVYEQIKSLKKCLWMNSNKIGANHE